MTILEQLRALYFDAKPASIAEDFERAIDLFKQIETDDDREKAAVFMDGIAEMRREWNPRAAKPGPPGARGATPPPGRRKSR